METSFEVYDSSELNGQAGVSISVDVGCDRSHHAVVMTRIERRVPGGGVTYATELGYTYEGPCDKSCEPKFEAHNYRRLGMFGFDVAAHTRQSTSVVLA